MNAFFKDLRICIYVFILIKYQNNTTKVHAFQTLE